MMRKGGKLDEIERERAKRRMIAAHASPGNFPEQDLGQTRDKVAEAIGIGSGGQYEKAKRSRRSGSSGGAFAPGDHLAHKERRAAR